MVHQMVMEANVQLPTFCVEKRPYPPQMTRSWPSRLAPNSLLGSGSAGRSEAKVPQRPQVLTVATAGWSRLSTSPPSSNTVSGDFHLGRGKYSL